MIANLPIIDELNMNPKLDAVLGSKQNTDLISLIVVIHYFERKKSSDKVLHICSSKMG